MPDIIAYYRVSTQMQGAHGLGMAGQRAAVAALCASRNSTIIAEYEEVETARRDTLQNRPQLMQALRHAKRARAILAIARFDRLARNVLVTSQLLESGVEFVACDNPYANRMTIQIIAVMAENESRLISERVKAAFAARKARGLPSSSGRLFSPEESMRGRLAAAASHRARAIEAYRDIAHIVVRLRSQGSLLRDIVSHLEAAGHRNQYDRPIDVQVVRSILRRADVPFLPPFLARTDERASLLRAKGVAAAQRLILLRVKAAYDAASPVAREMYAEKATRRTIVVRLNELGLRTHTGRPWTKGTMRKLLLSPIRRDGCTAMQIRNRVTASAAAKRQAATERFSPIRRIVEHLRSLNYTFGDIAIELNSLGYIPPTADRWSARIVLQGMQREQKRQRLTASGNMLSTMKNSKLLRPGAPRGV